MVLRLGGGRHSKEDRIDPRVGIRRLAKVGEEVGRGEILAEVHAATEADADAAAIELRDIVRLSDVAPPPASTEPAEVFGT